MDSRDYYRHGVRIAEYVRDLEDGECPCKVESLRGWFTDGIKVYRKVYV